MSTLAAAAGATGVAPASGRRHALAFGLAVTVIPLGSTMLAVAMPAIGTDLGVDPASLGTWLVTAYLVVAIAGTAIGGRVGDAVGTTRALHAGQALCAIGAAAGALAPDVPWLVAARLLMAAGGAIVVPACMSLLREITPAERRPRAFGVFGAIMGLAAAAGPLAGGLLTEHGGWRATFASQLVPLVLSLLLSRGLPRREAAPPRSGSAGLLRDLLGSRAWVGGAVTSALQNCAMYATLFLVPLLLVSLRHETESVAGQALLAMTLCMVFGSFAGGHVAEALGIRATLVVSALASAGGLALLRDVHAIAHALDALPGLALLGFGVGLANGPANGAAMSGVPPARAATAAGLMSALRYVGGVAGMLALSSVKATASPEIAEALIARAFTGLLVVAALAIPVALLLPARRARG